MVHFHLRVEFAWGGGCLWADDEATRAAWDVGPLEERLPLSAGLRAQLAALTRWHDQALDWHDPLAPSPWHKDEAERFAAAVRPALGDLRRELGEGYAVRYQPLGPGPAIDC